MEYEILLERLVISFGGSEQQQKIIRRQMMVKEVQKKQMRQCLCRENEVMKRAFYILDGTVSLSIKTKTISQLGSGQTLNLEILFNHWRCKYTIACMENAVTYIVLNEDEVLTYAQNNLNHIHAVMLFREQHFKQIAPSQQSALLPHLTCRQFSQQKGIIHELFRPNDSFHKNISSEKNLQSLAKRQRNKEIPNTYQLTKLKEFNIKTLQRTPKYDKPQVNVDYLARMKIKKPKYQIQKNRNQILFRQYIKNIVDRKIRYEQKHFKIIKNQISDKKPTLSKQYQQEKIQNYFNI